MSALDHTIIPPHAVTSYNTGMERPRSESPSIRPSAVILEWNFMASRINAVVAMMRAHQNYRIPLNLQKVADGMTIERAQGALISGRLAIQGLRLSGEWHQNHDLAFRHTVDKGYRILRTLLELNMTLPRWGSYSDTPPPPFESLRFYPLTDEDDWTNFCGASGVDSDGTRWWTQTSAMDVNGNGAAKSLDAAKIWLRLTAKKGEDQQEDRVTDTEDIDGWDIPDPDIAQELRYLMAYIRGTQRSVKDSIRNLEAVMSEVESRLRDEYMKDSST